MFVFCSSFVRSLFVFPSFFVRPLFVFPSSFVRLSYKLTQFFFSPKNVRRATTECATRTYTLSLLLKRLHFH
ncbi:hypothetical protein HMPREF1320_1913 [Capnocytophaga sp. oral taxon 335 str. F0486]|nr:hypothetical protein HMPREF1320_1913 [Capnocytophaga sp. oral taxon 335 str. F0486]